MSAEAELTIFVTDVNDNPPVFTQNLYVTNILENMTMVSQQWLCCMKKAACGMPMYRVPA